MGAIRIIISAGAALLWATSAHSGPTADIAIKSCLTTLKLPQAACDCIGGKVESDLNEKQQAFFVASIQGDRNAMSTAQAKLSGDEMIAVATFMTTAPQSCQQ